MGKKVMVLVNFTPWLDPYIPHLQTLGIIKTLLPDKIIYFIDTGAPYVQMGGVMLLTPILGLVHMSGSMILWHAKMTKHQVISVFFSHLGIIQAGS